MRPRDVRRPLLSHIRPGNQDVRIELLLCHCLLPVGVGRHDKQPSPRLDLVLPIRLACRLHPLLLVHSHSVHKPGGLLTRAPPQEGIPETLDMLYRRIRPMLFTLARARYTQPGAARSGIMVGGAHHFKRNHIFIVVHMPQQAASSGDVYGHHRRAFSSSRDSEAFPP